MPTLASSTTTDTFLMARVLFVPGVAAWETPIPLMMSGPVTDTTDVQLVDYAHIGVARAGAELSRCGDMLDCEVCTHGKQRRMWHPRRESPCVFRRCLRCHTGRLSQQATKRGIMSSACQPVIAGRPTTSLAGQAAGWPGLQALPSTMLPPARNRQPTAVHTEVSTVIHAKVSEADGIATLWPRLQLVLMLITTLGCLVEFAGVVGTNMLGLLHPDQSAEGVVDGRKGGGGMGRDVATLGHSVASCPRAPDGLLRAAAGVGGARSLGPGLRTVARSHLCSPASRSY